MRVFVKWTAAGGDAGTVDLGGDDDLAAVRIKVAKVCRVHPTLQQLVFGGKLLREQDNKTVAEYGITLESDLRLGFLPAPTVMRLNVGGTPYKTMLSTLVHKIPSSVLAKMFDGVRQHHRQGPDGLVEGAPGDEDMSTVLLPKDPDAEHTWFIDRHGPSFEFVLNYLRHDEATAGEHFPLPRSDAQREQLAAEAKYFGLPELAAACECPLRGMALGCGGVGVTVEDILSLSAAERAEDYDRLKLSHPMRKAIEAAVLRRAVEAARVREAAEAEAARVRKAAEDVARLREGLGRLELSEAGLVALAAADLGVADALSLDGAAARALGLSEEDARKVGEGLPVREFVFEGVDNSVAKHGKFDQAGVLNHIGTAGGTRAWVNPCSSGVSVAWSSVKSGPEEQLVSKWDWQAEGSYTDDQPNPSWMRVDLGATRSLAVHHYALRHSAYSRGALRNWELQGANVSIYGPWTTLRRHDNDASIDPNEGGFVAAWPVEGAAPFRFFRIRQHGPNANNQNYLVCAGIELYGMLTE
eukprot:COSAG02_NODE_312_length_24941_cov_60.672611_7_plen_527_part_00